MIKKKLLNAFACACLVGISGCSSILSMTTDQPIPEDPTERTWGTVMDDHSIETYAAVNIEKSDAKFSQARVVVVSYNGIVLITGQVPNEQLKQLATSEVKKLKKVRKVYNEMQISGPIGFPAQSSDSWITSKVRTELFTTGGVPSGQIKVVTENGVVYLMGLVTPEQADKAVNLTKETYGVQKIVKLFQYIQT